MDLSILASAFPVRRRFGPSLGWTHEWPCLGRLQVCILHVLFLVVGTVVSQQRVEGQDSTVPAPSDLWLRDLVALQWLCFFFSLMSSSMSFAIKTQLAVIFVLFSFKVCDKPFNREVQECFGFPVFPCTCRYHVSWLKCYYFPTDFFIHIFLCIVIFFKIFHWLFNFINNFLLRSLKYPVHTDCLLVFFLTGYQYILSSKM